MITPAPSLLSREAVLAAAGQHPYAALTLGGGEVTGWTSGGALVWRATGPSGPVVVAMGEPVPALSLVRGLLTAGELDGVRWIHLPRTGREETERHLPVLAQDEWDFLWTVTAPPPHDGEPQVAELTETDYPQVIEVLDDALPDSTSRPGDPRIRRWHGIRHGARVVAVAGDRSSGGVGFLAGIAVRSDRQGKGLGAAITAAATRSLLAEFGIASLGVMADNTGAIALYRRLGYTSAMTRTSVRLTD